MCIDLQDIMLSMDYECLVSCTFPQIMNSDIHMEDCRLISVFFFFEFNQITSNGTVIDIQSIFLKKITCNLQVQTPSQSKTPIDAFLMSQLYLLNICKQISLAILWISSWPWWYYWNYYIDITTMPTRID